MNNMISQEAIFTDYITVAYPQLDNALLAWDDATTDPTSARREDLLHARGKR